MALKIRETEYKKKDGYTDVTNAFRSLSALAKYSDRDAVFGASDTVNFLTVGSLVIRPLDISELWVFFITISNLFISIVFPCLKILGRQFSAYTKKTQLPIWAGYHYLLQ